MSRPSPRRSSRARFAGASSWTSIADGSDRRPAPSAQDGNLRLRQWRPGLVGQRNAGDEGHRQTPGWRGDPDALFGHRAARLAVVLQPPETGQVVDAVEGAAPMSV